MTDRTEASLLRRAAAEAVGTAYLLAAIVGSGIMAERLAGGNAAIALLANSLATGAALVALVMAFGGVSGAHFNPLVTAADVAAGVRPLRDLAAYAPAQVLGGLLGVGGANAMFGLPLFFASRRARSGPGLLLAEVAATAGLLLVIRGTARSRREAVPWAVGLYIAAAYWFTSSTSFANPAVVLARTATDTFAGIRPRDAGPFFVAELSGAAAGVLLGGLLWPRALAAVGETRRASHHG